MQNLAPTDQTEDICNVSVTQSVVRPEVLNIAASAYFIFTFQITQYWNYNAWILQIDSHIKFIDLTYVLSLDIMETSTNFMSEDEFLCSERRLFNRR